jgi:hypothetical protein
MTKVPEMVKSMSECERVQGRSSNGAKAKIFSTSARWLCTKIMRNQLMLELKYRVKVDEYVEMHNQAPLMILASRKEIVMMKTVPNPRSSAWQARLG